MLEVLAIIIGALMIIFGLDASIRRNYFWSGILLIVAGFVIVEFGSFYFLAGHIGKY